MNIQKKHSLKVPVTLFTITFIGLVFLIIIGIKLSTTELITFTSAGDTQITITKSQDYFVLLDTNGKRETLEVGSNEVTNYIIVRDDANDATYMTLLLFTSDLDGEKPPISQIEFDKQIKTKGHLSFGKITLEKGTYSIVSENLIIDDDFGDFALLGSNYVRNIGFFSFSAIATFTFALLGYKSYKTYERKPLSAYQMKHVK